MSEEVQMQRHQNPGEAIRGRLGTARDSAVPEAEVQGRANRR